MIVLLTFAIIFFNFEDVLAKASSLACKIDVFNAKKYIGTLLK